LLTEGTESTWMVEGIYTHPRFVAGRNGSDVALVKLKGNIQFRHEVAPVCLPKAGISYNTTCVMTGWGQNHGE